MLLLFDAASLGFPVASLTINLTLSTIMIFVSLLPYLTSYIHHHVPQSPLKLFLPFPTDTRQHGDQAEGWRGWQAKPLSPSPSPLPKPHARCQWACPPCLTWAEYLIDFYLPTYLPFPSLPPSHTLVSSLCFMLTSFFFHKEVLVLIYGCYMSSLSGQSQTNIVYIISMLPRLVNLLYTLYAFCSCYGCLMPVFSSQSNIITWSN